MGTLEQSEPTEATPDVDTPAPTDVEPDVDAPTEAPADDDVVEVDITESLTDDQIQSLFDAFDDEDWLEVDRLIDEFERTGVYADVKAGGADRNRGSAEKLRHYWTVGEGAAKIRWGTSGDWTRCVEHLSKYLGPRAKGYCALRHKERNGFYPGSKLNKSDGADTAYHEIKDSTATQGEPMIEHKTVGVKGMNIVSAEKGIVETIISVTGIVDNVKDRIIPGAYSKTLAKRKPKGVWCVDAATEALTADGWKSYTDLRVGDLIYTLGEDGLARFQPVQAVNVFPAESRRMRQITTSVHSSLTTENHRWLVQTRDGSMRWRTTDTLVPEDKIVRAAPGADLPDEPKYNDAFVQVVAWFWTEGHIDGKRLSISQSSTVNPDKCRRIEGSLTHVFHGAWNVQTKANGQAEYRLNHAPSAAVLAVTGDDKAPTADFLRSLTQAQLSMFIATCIDGDGHRQYDGAEFFYQRSDHSVAMFQMACALAGVATNTVLREYDDSHYGRPVHRVTLSKRATTMPLKAISEQQRTGGGERVSTADEWVDHDGVVWCPTTPAGTWLARRDGTVWFTGNSHDWDTPVSKTLDVKELMPGDSELPATMPDGDPWPVGAGALKVKTQFNLDTQRGREAYSDVVFFGEEQEWSIGYNVPVGGAKVDTKSGVREIETLELYEYSPVLFGAMPLARTTSVKEAQMALKALKGGAAAWLAEAKDDETVDDDETVEERTATAPDDIEADLADDLDGKNYSLPADQMILVKRAIATLTDLLSVVQGDVESKSDTPEDMADTGDGDYQEYDTLVEALDDLVDDEEVYNTLIDSANAIDNALQDDNVDALDEASNQFLDGVQTQMKRDGVNVQLLRDLASTIADLIEQAAGEGDDNTDAPDEDSIEKKDEDEVPTDESKATDDGSPENSTVLLDMSEFKSITDYLN